MVVNEGTRTISADSRRLSTCISARWWQPVIVHPNDHTAVICSLLSLARCSKLMCDELCIFCKLTSSFLDESSLVPPRITIISRCWSSIKNSPKMWLVTYSISISTLSFCPPRAHNAPRLDSLGSQTRTVSIYFYRSISDQRNLTFSSLSRICLFSCQQSTSAKQVLCGSRLNPRNSVLKLSAT